MQPVKEAHTPAHESWKKAGWVAPNQKAAGKQPQPGSGLRGWAARGVCLPVKQPAALVHWLAVAMHRVETSLQRKPQQPGGLAGAEAGVWVGSGRHHHAPATL